MSLYIKEGFEDDIRELPLHVQVWFGEKYAEFYEDISYGNDGWPTFYICPAMINGKKVPVFLNLSGVDNGDEGMPGYKISTAIYDDDEETIFGIDGNEETLLRDESEDLNLVVWELMMAKVDKLINENNKG